MNRGLVVVLSSGRSGSSTVAECLHRGLGVYMGYRMSIGPDNPFGYFEDLSWEVACEQLDQGKLTEKGFITATIPSLIEGSFCRSNMVGVKSPRMLRHMPHVLAIARLNGAETFVIRTKRDRELQHKSWMRSVDKKLYKLEHFTGDTTEEKLTNYLDYCEHYMDLIETDLTIEFGAERKPMKDIVAEIDSAIPRIRELSDGPHPILWCPSYVTEHSVTITPTDGSIEQRVDTIDQRIKWGEK